MTVLVLAGNARQYEDAKRRGELPGDKHQLIGSARTLVGPRGVSFVFVRVGTWWYRSDIAEIEGELRRIGATEVGLLSTGGTSLGVTH